MPAIWPHLSNARRLSCLLMSRTSMSSGEEPAQPPTDSVRSRNHTATTKSFCQPLKLWNERWSTCSGLLEE
jgi:hypothetical protein